METVLQRAHNVATMVTHTWGLSRQAGVSVPSLPSLGTLMLTLPKDFLLQIRHAAWRSQVWESLCLLLCKTRLCHLGMEYCFSALLSGPLCSILCITRSRRQLSRERQDTSPHMEWPRLRTSWARNEAAYSGGTPLSHACLIYAKLMQQILNYHYHKSYQSKGWQPY